MLKFTFSTPVISHWTRRQMRLQHWCEVLSVLLVEDLRRGRWLKPLEQSFGIELVAWQARVSAVESRKLALCAAECVDHPVGKAAKK